VVGGELDSETGVPESFTYWKTKSGSSWLSNDRNSSSLAFVRPLEFHCIHLRFLIIDLRHLGPNKGFRGRGTCCRGGGFSVSQSAGLRSWG
jgi:hypothetical protein